MQPNNSSPDNTLEAQHAAVVARWRTVLERNAAHALHQLNRDDLEELASILEESYQDALVRLAAQGRAARQAGGPDSSRRPNNLETSNSEAGIHAVAEQEALRVLGDWSDLLQGDQPTHRTATLERASPHSNSRKTYAEEGSALSTEHHEPAPAASPSSKPMVSTAASVSTVSSVPSPSPALRLLSRHSNSNTISWWNAGPGLLRFAARSLWRAKSLSGISVSLLSLGLGAAIAVFAVFHAVVLDPLPYPDLDRLGIVRIDALGQTDMPRVSASNVLDFRSSADSLSHVYLANFPKLSLGKDRDFSLVRVASIDPGLPTLLGVQPAMGRLFDSTIDSPTTPFGNVLLSDRLWRTRYSEDPDIVGKTILLQDRDVQVVGVLQPGQQLWLRPGQAADIDLWTVRRPLQDRDSILRYTAFVKVQDGFTFDQATAEAHLLGQRGHRIDGEEGEIPIYRVTPLMEHLVEDSRTSLLLLLVSALFVLLLASVNVAGLLAARSVAKRGEWAVRAALGASRGRLLLSGLVEGVLLALVSGALGLLTALVGIRAVVHSLGWDLPRVENTSVGPMVFLFAGALTAVVALVVGLLPALRASRAGNRAAPTGAGAALGVRGGLAKLGRHSGPLVAAQVALALLLLAGTGVLVRTFLELQQVELGFEPEQVLHFDFSLTSEFAEDGAKRMELNRSVLRRLEELPEVASISLTNHIPMSGQNLASYSFDDASRRDFGELTASFHRVFPNYFSTIGTNLLAGRDFNDTDMETPNASVIISRSLADAAWPDSPAVGKYLTIEFAAAAGGTELRDARIIGVVEEIREVDLHSDQLPQAYLAYGERSWAQDYVARTTVPPSTFIPKLKRTLGSFGPGLFVDDAEPLSARIANATAEQRRALSLAGLFSLLALLIAALGIYAAMAQRVVARKAEIGLRMAMGAQQRQVLSWVLRRALTFTSVGVIFGLALSWALLRLLEGYLYQVSARDPLTLTVVAIVLIVAAVVASWLPARRAAAVDPALVLSED